MKKDLKTLVLAFGLALPAMAQESADSLAIHDAYDFSFSESQLDEDADDGQSVSSLAAAKNNLYLSQTAYLFSHARFNHRAYDGMYSTTYLNGMELNSLELGRFSWGTFGGLNDVTRSRESVTGFNENTFGYTGVRGGENINARASNMPQGNKFTLTGTNRNYVARSIYTFGTGMMDNGWAFAGSVGYRWGKNGAIKGVFYNSLGYFLAAEKRINDKHSISLLTLGAPTERSQQGASTEEAYWLANSHYYNPYWGYQGGKERNSRVVNSFEPITMLTWDWKISDRSRLNSSVGFKYSKYSTTALGWDGNAYDPRPDYYKNLPSAVFDVYDPEKNNPEWLGDHGYFVQEWNEIYNHWTASEANRQLDWDRLYYVNRQNEALGGNTLYYQERRHNDQQVWSFNTTFNQNINQKNKYALGLQLNSTKGMHYKTMEDLLGGTKYFDVDKFSVKDYGPNSSEAQNDLNNPNRRIYQGDKFGYNYNIFVNQAKLWGQYQHTGKYFSTVLGAQMVGQTMEREGLMKNGRAPENSFGSSGVSGFLGGGARAAFIFTPAANHRIMLAAGYDIQPPLSRNAFVAPRLQNNFVDNLTNEKILTTEASYAFRIGNFSGHIGGYYTEFSDQVEQTAYYNDQQSTFTYLTMTGIKKRHYGLEAAFNYQVTSAFSVNLTGTLAEAQYINNPYAQINYEGMNAAETAKLNSCANPVTGEENDLRVVADGIRVGGTPLAAVGLGFKYNVNGWYLEANVNYYDRIYVGFSQYRRLTSTYKTAGKFYTPSSVNAEGQLVYDVTGAELAENGGVLFNDKGDVVKAYAAHQEKYDGGFMVDASIGKSIRLSKGRSININLQLKNITNNTNLKTGGYEQNRDDNYYKEEGGTYTKGEAKAYKFSKNSKYYYAFAFNAFLNIGFRF